MPRRVLSPSPEMMTAVTEMFDKLEKISPDPSLVGQCPELPGIVLERVTASTLDRAGEDYRQVGSDYEKIRSEYLKALACHPVGRALALLAVGPAGLQMMEQGYVPALTTESVHGSLRSVRSRQETFNCHHVIPRSLRPADPSLQINHPSNFVLANTTRHGRDQSQNPHHFWHGLLLHPQTHQAPEREIPVYAVRPLFPFYPPIVRGFRTLEELRKNLALLGSPPLPENWEKKILEFSKAAGHKAYLVPAEYHSITQLFGHLYKTENKTLGLNESLRAHLAEKGAALAARFLPAGAYLNGKQLPPEHKPTRILPIIEPDSTVQTPVEELFTPKKALSKTSSKKRSAGKIATMKSTRPKI